ncbi:MAG TPA: DUF4276 family protein [Ktedonobacteraceae bacterium]|jgi:hypothetical protein
MSVLMLAFYGEGRSDREFLPPLIQRTSDAILAHYAQSVVEIWDIRIIEKKRGDLGTCILQASKEVGECHALLVHSDADRLGYWEAREDRFTPGQTLVHNYSGWSCQNLLPVIPVREKEAWMLADFEALSAVPSASLEQ